MKHLCLWASAILLTVTLAWTETNQRSLQLQLLPGQTLKLQLSSGDYEIEPGAANKVVVISKIEHDSQQQPRPRFGIDTSATEASVRVDGPKDYSAVIQVPKNSNLSVRLIGGRLRVDGINGNKDIESNAADVSIDVGRPEDYARVDASVDRGHIDAAPFQVAQAGFEQSFSRVGPGSYRLHAHVGTGEIKLYSGTL
ncbi:MAG TPA: hypothetical protein VFP59_05485 [Candidatus Angelobacter sp.]|nr:hypothetical protein [Candidatus Angelobacter sp.]